MSDLCKRLTAMVFTLALTTGIACAGDTYLGITMSSLSPGMAKALQLDEGQGVLIDEVVADSPADEGGLEAGDVIIAIAGEEIEGLKGLSRAIHRHEPGDEVAITVLRQGDRRELMVTLGERKKRSFTVWTDKEVEKNVQAWIGDEGEGKVFTWKDEDGKHQITIDGLGLSGLDRGFLGIVPGEDEDESGVVIDELVDDGPAEKAGLRAGDRIVSLDDERIATSSELHEFLEDTDPGETLQVKVVRDGRKKEYEVTLGEMPSKLKIAENLHLFMPPDPGDPSHPRFYEYHTGTLPPTLELQELRKMKDEERQEVEEMQKELQALKEELAKMREELEKKK
jgi:membrane-associated protease RseP (regulator of RpoE activity)